MITKNILLPISLFFLVTPGRSQQTILWRISGPDSGKVSWLLGTFHSLGESFVDSLPIIREKIRLADMVITEAEIDRPKIIRYYNSRAGSDTLEKIVSPENLQLIKEVLGGGHVDIHKYTPGELYVKLNIGYIPTRCVPASAKDSFEYDEYLQALARQDQKPQFFLENTIMQTELIDSLSRFISWKFFRKNIPSILAKYRDDKVLRSACQEIRKYIAMDIDYAFDKKCAESPLLKGRNEDWMKKIPALLEEHSCFIAVGLYHLCYRCGLIRQLRQLGYRVEPVDIRSPQPERGN